jgi:hypothetical protein
VLTSKHRFKLYAYAISLAPFALLFLVHGERKYLIAPALMTVARFVKARNISSILIAFAAAAVGWVLFVYLGHLRIYEYSIFEMFSQDALNSFMNQFRDEIGGETVTLFGTASAAYVGFVKPSPYFGDYLLAWLYAVPQFFFEIGIFQSTADRFAVAYAPEAAADGMGWGFSFWGEAYGVMGVMGIYVLALVIATIFQTIRAKAFARNLSGPFGVWLLAGLYEGLWLTRSDFAHFMKGYLVYDFIIIFLIYSISRFVVSSAKRRGITRR